MTSNLPTLPTGWEIHPLEKVAFLNMGQSPDSSTYNTEGIGLPFFQGKKDFGKLHPKPTQYCSIPVKIAQPNDILMSVRAPVGPTNIANAECCIGRGLAAIRANPEILDLFYLHYFFKYFETEISEMGKGSTFAAITKVELANLQIPLPPLNEQKRLVSLLDTLFAKIDRSIELLSENITAADALLPSALNTVFGELVEQWETKTVNDIAFVKGGKRLPKGEQLLEKETPYPYLRVTDFTDDGTISTKKMLYLPPEVHDKIKRYTISHEDLYITNVGNTIGKSGIIPKELEGANLTENAVKLVYKDKKNISNKFVFYFTKSATFIFQLESATKQMAIPKLAIMRLGEINIPLPPLDIQTQTVEYLDTIRTKVEILKRIQNDKITNLKALKASILDRAFKGEL